MPKIEIEDFPFLKKQVEEVIIYSQKYNFDINADDLLNQWAINKSALYNTLPFDENLTYEFPDKVSFSIGNEVKEEALNRFIRELWEYPFLQEFLRNNKSNFFENRIVEDYKAPLGVARRGMKIIKAFKLFFNTDNPVLKRLQDEASEILNMNKIEGYLCLSIHPLDYLSISDNANKWHTCHSLDSDYRVGNLNYMADKHTAIFYIKTSQEDEKITNFPQNIPWNSKKWRTLLFFDENINFVFAGKQYPIEINEALNYFQNILIGSHFTFGPWHDEQLEKTNINGYTFKFERPVIPVGNEMRSISDIFQPGENTHQYNDILRNEKYNKQVKYAYLTSKVYYFNAYKSGINYGKEHKIVKYLFKEGKIKMTIGKEVNCLHCGTGILTIPELMVCPDCAIKYEVPDLDEDYFPICDICGEQYVSYRGYWENGTNYCPNCYYNYHEINDEEGE